jgi:hypothetical protein
MRAEEFWAVADEDLIDRRGYRRPLARVNATCQIEDRTVMLAILLARKAIPNMCRAQILSAVESADTDKNEYRFGGGSNNVEHDLISGSYICYNSLVRIYRPAVDSSLRNFDIHLALDDGATEASFMGNYSLNTQVYLYENETWH